MAERLTSGTPGKRAVGGNEADPTMADPLVSANLGLVYDLAARLSRGRSIGVELNDLVGAGVQGLIQAARAFDPSRGLAFSTFAVARIRGAMLDELRRWDRAPRAVRRKERQIKSSVASLRSKLEREPTQAEVAADLGVSLEDLYRWHLDLARHREESLEADPAHVRDRRSEDVEGSEGDATELIERIGRSEAVQILQDCLTQLPEREQRVLALYYFENLRLREIAQLVGVTESRISQVRHAALAKLKSFLLERGVEP
jgi:RNA polymerase sigma factor for flagellar operon FliA